MTNAYFMLDEGTLDMWLELLGPAACGKLLVCCAQYYFSGAEPDDIKLTAKARTLFEGEKSRLDHRRARAAAKTVRAAEAAEKSDRRAASVENSAADHAGRGKAAKKSRKSSRKVCEKTSPTGRVPAETASHPKHKHEHNPQTPTPRATGGGRGGGGVMSAAEFAALAGTIGYDSPTAYGGTLLRAV